MFNEQTMTKQTTRPPANKTYAHSVPFFENNVAIREAYEAASGTTSKQHGFESANAATDFASDLKSAIYDMMTDSKVAVNEKDSENALALNTLSGRHNAEMRVMRAQMTTLTSALATISTTLNDNGGVLRKRSTPSHSNQMQSHRSSHHDAKKEQMLSRKTTLGCLECGSKNIGPRPQRKHRIKQKKCAWNHIHTQRRQIRRNKLQL